MIIVLQTYLNISCGITRTIQLLLKNSSSKLNMFVMTYGGDNTSVLSCRRVKSYNNFLSLHLSLFKTLLACKNDQIIIHSFHRSFDFSAFILKIIFPRIKTLTSVQSKVFGKRIFSYKSDLIITCSHAIKNHLVDYFQISSSRVKVIYNFIDPKHIENCLNENDEIKIENGTNKLIIGFIGRFDIKEKGIDVLLNAFKHIYSQDNNLSLIFVGSGKDEDLINRYKFVHTLPITIIPEQTNVYKYYNLIDFLVLPSRREPFGIVIIEAGYMKKLVIASKVDGIPEIIEDGVNGLLFENENHLQLAEKILFLKNNKEVAQRLADENYKKVTSSFLAEHKVPEYQREYLSLVQNKYRD